MFNVESVDNSVPEKTPQPDRKGKTYQVAAYLARSNKRQTSIDEPQESFRDRGY